MVQCRGVIVENCSSGQWRAWRFSWIVAVTE
jgi:hypothetical protein